MYGFTSRKSGIRRSMPSGCSACLLRQLGEDSQPQGPGKGVAQAGLPQEHETDHGGKEDKQPQLMLLFFVLGLGHGCFTP